jgi:hypothetical protein
MRSLTYHDYHDYHRLRPGSGTGHRLLAANTHHAAGGLAREQGVFRASPL